MKTYNFLIIKYSRHFRHFRHSKLLFLFILMIFGPFILHAQKILTLKECYDRAMITNALAGEKEAYSKISQLKDNNISKGWLPTLDANGSFVYNFSAIDMSSVLGSLPIPGIADAIKPLPHEQYKISFDINQVIYDGGAIKGARALEKADLSINEKQTETDLYKLRGQINTYYFNLMLLSRQKELLNNYLELIIKRISSMQSALNNGVIIKSDIDVLTAEKIKLEQQLSENEIRRAYLLKILSDLTGTEIDASTEFTIPPQTVELTNELLRPELQLFDLRKEQLAAGMKVIETKRMPKAFGFATLGYGNPPGSNFFKDEFAPYYILGAGVKWNIFDWDKAKNEKQVITLQLGIIDNRKNDLTDNLNRLLESKNSEITSLRALIETDSELITLRKRITASAESQYENGTITATEYLNEMNSERQALVNFEIHKINLSLARIEYLNISGKEIE
ncbi:MAG: TolC family protein [Bacteroidales bacterium]|nr:TolC family protein [Bacteroidales bacterium]